VCQIRQVLTSCAMRHISRAPWYVRLDRIWHLVQCDTFPLSLGVSDQTGSDILYNVTHFPCSLVCQIWQVLTSCAMRHISFVHWCVRLDRFHCIDINVWTNSNIIKWYLKYFWGWCEAPTNQSNFILNIRYGGHMIYRVQILDSKFNIGYIWGEIFLLRVSNAFVDIFGMKHYFDMWIQVGSIECLMGFVFHVPLS
jgi:hypothetical protein